MKRIICKLILLVATLCVSTSIYADDSYEGRIIDGIRYNLYPQDNAAIVVEYSYSDNKNGYKGNLVIPETVNYLNKTYKVIKISTYAFDGCSDLKSIIMPNTITEIGDWAFRDCTSLTSIAIPNSVTKIYYGAFMNCTGLTSVTIGNSVANIGARAFDGCTGLTSVMIPNSVTSIGASAFSDCTGIKSVVIPNSVASIDGNIFNGCTSLTDIVVESKNPTYDSRDNCNGIIETAKDCLIIGCKSTIIPNSVTSIDGAFSRCSGLVSVTIPNSVTSIGDSAFFGCSSLTSVVIPNSVTSIGKYAFAQSGLTSIVIPNAVTSIGRCAFGNCSNLSSAIFNAEKCAKMDYAFSFFDGSFNSTLNANLTSLTIGDKVTIIPQLSFAYCSALTSVSIPNSVTTIGDSAFKDCSSLSSVVFNAEKCTEMGSESSPVFEGCTSVANITIGEKATTIPAYAFLGCTKMTSLFYNAENCEIAYSALPNRANLSTLIIGEKVATIPSRAFSGCTRLTLVTIPNSVTSIDDSAFSGCTGLASVTIPNSVTSIGDSAFSGCTGLSSATIGNSVANIGVGAFSGCTGLASVTIPNSTTSIGRMAFYNCIGLQSVIIGAGVQSIGEKAIGYRTAQVGNSVVNPVAKVIWLPNTPPSGYESVQAHVYYCANNQYSSLRGLYIYQNLSSMFEVDGIRYIPVSPSKRTCDAIDCTYAPELTTIQLDKNIYYKGIQMTLTGVRPYVCYNNTYITDITINYDDISNYAFSECSKLTKATLSGLLTRIGTGAFSKCTTLEGITIPNSVESIGQYSFRGCSAMTHVKIGTELKIIPQDAFRWCSSLSSITIPKNVTEIGNYAFDGCTSLADVYIEDREDELSLGSNGSSPLFSSCPLKTVYIGGNISYSTDSSDGYSPFYRNTSLEKVIITDKETEISENEFYGCTGLKYITMGDGIEKIGDWAFSGCSSLDFFRVGSNVKTIGKEAFSDCTAMTKLITTAPVPPTCGSQALDDINKWTCELFVNKESINQYKAAEQWKEFFFISEYDGVDDVSMDTVDALYDVYNLQGVRVGSGMRETEVTADVLPHGVYILVSPQSRKKLKI